MTAAFYVDILRKAPRSSRTPQQSRRRPAGALSFLALPIPIIPALLTARTPEREGRRNGKTVYKRVQMLGKTRLCFTAAWRRNAGLRRNSHFRISAWEGLQRITAFVFNYLPVKPGDFLDPTQNVENRARAVPRRFFRTRLGKTW